MLHMHSHKPNHLRRLLFVVGAAVLFTMLVQWHWLSEQPQQGARPLPVMAQIGESIAS